jgi:hypothetical protein
VVGLFLTTLSVFAQATRTDRVPEGSRTSDSRGISGTSTAETVKILLAGINQAGFEKYYATNDAGAVNVIGLTADAKLPAGAKALGRVVSLQSTDQVATGSLSNYFFVGNVKNEDQHVSVSLSYFYNHSKEGYKVVMVDIELVQTGDQYQIVNADFKGDVL